MVMDALRVEAGSLRDILLPETWSCAAGCLAAFCCEMPVGTPRSSKEPSVLVTTENDSPGIVTDAEETGVPAESLTHPEKYTSALEVLMNAKTTRAAINKTAGTDRMVFIGEK
jgi:hypothetical protein